MDKQNTYELLDSGNGRRYEKFGKYFLVRPCAQAIWPPKFVWDRIDASFSREDKNGWRLHRDLPDAWPIIYKGVQLELKRTDFGHLGIFPEHAIFCDYLTKWIRPNMRILHLFSYTGFLTLFCAKLNAHICHVDASKPSVDWARKNAQLNGLTKAPIRWIVDDVIKFVKREIRRDAFYDGIILDPPTFGRGPQGQVFKIEKDLAPLLENLQILLGKKGKFILLSCHTPMVTPLGLEQLFQSYYTNTTDKGEIILQASNGHNIPSGSYLAWIR